MDPPPGCRFLRSHLVGHYVTVGYTLEPRGTKVGNWKRRVNTYISTLSPCFGSAFVSYSYFIDYTAITSYKMSELELRRANPLPGCMLGRLDMCRTAQLSDGS